MKNNFENKIRDLIKDEVHLISKSDMKSRLMQSIEPKSKFWESLKEVFSGVQISVRSKVVIKEKLLAVVEGEQSSRFNIFSLRKTMAFSTAFAMVFVLVLQPFSLIPTVSASLQTRIANYSGSVEVKRSDASLKAAKEMSLQEGDLLSTGPAGFAEVVFSDNSIIRLGNATSVSLKKLDRFGEKEVYQVRVLDGEVWGHMLGVDSDSVFKFTAANLSGTVKTDATFDIEVTDSFTKLLTIDESIDLLLSHNGELVPTSLREGKMIKVKSETPYLSYLDTLAFNEQLSEFDLDWVQSNLNQDRIYEQKLLERIALDRKNAAGITPDNPFYAFKQLKRATRVAFAIDPVKKNQLEIGYANQKLLEAEVMISEGKKEQANKLIKDYETKVVEVKEDIDEIKKSDPDKAVAIEKTLASSLEVQKKDLKKVLPDNEVYEIKQVVNNVELVVASTTAKKKKVEIKQAADTLQEAKELAEGGHDELAKEQLSLFVGKIDEATKYIESIPEDEVEEVVESLIQTHSDTKEILESTSELSEKSQDLKDGIGIVSEVTEVTIEQAVDKIDARQVDPQVAKDVKNLRIQETPVEQLESSNLKVDNVVQAIQGLSKSGLVFEELVEE